MKAYLAIGNNELEHMPKLKKTEECPSCGKSHRVDFGKDKDGDPTDLGFVKCPKSKKAYLVAIAGKRIPNKKGKL